MNVLYLNTHDIGMYLETYGYRVDTPNLLEFSRDGMAFANMYCASPTCSPSRGSLLSGQYPHSNGLIGLSHRGFCMDGNHHMANFLRNHGFETVISGVQHEVRLHQEEKLGYEICLNPPEYYRRDMEPCRLYTWQDQLAANQAIKYLRDRSGNGKPFYLAVGFGCTHREYPQVPDDFSVDYVQVPQALPDLPEIRSDMAAAMIAIHTVDRLCGDILRTLKEVGEYDNTLIIFTTDHGLPFPRMKCNLRRDGTGVSFMIRYPAMKRKGISRALLSNVDVFPTICDILELETPEWIQGTSFLPIINGEMEEIQEHIFGEINYHVGYEPARSVRTLRYHYIARWDNGYDKPVPANMDDCPVKEVFRQSGYFEKIVAREELYDLLFDPQEKNNLAGNMEYEHVLEDMKKRLFQWQKSTDDPLWSEGRIHLPKGAICCTPDSYSTKNQVILPECREYLEDLRDILQNCIN